MVIGYDKGCQKVRIHLLRIKPFVIVLIGTILIIAGIVYGGIMVGVPYQDPTPEMSAYENFHNHISDTIISVGFGIFLFGSLLGVIRLISRKVIKRNNK